MRPGTKGTLKAEWEQAEYPASSCLQSIGFGNRLRITFGAVQTTADVERRLIHTVQTWHESYIVRVSVGLWLDPSCWDRSVFASGPAQLPIVDMETAGLSMTLPVGAA